MKFQFQLNNDLINFFKYFKIRLLAARAGHAFLAITRRRLDVYIRFRSNTHTHISIRGWWRGWWWDHWLMTSLECMAHSPPANWTQHNTHAAPDPPLLWSSIFGLFMGFLLNIWIFHLRRRSLWSDRWLGQKWRRWPPTVPVSLRPNACTDRLALKTKVVERLKSYRLV